MLDFYLQFLNISFFSFAVHLHFKILESVSKFFHIGVAPFFDVEVCNNCLDSWLLTARAILVYFRSYRQDTVFLITVIKAFNTIPDFTSFTLKELVIIVSESSFALLAYDGFVCRGVFFLGLAFLEDALAGV